MPNQTIEINSAEYQPLRDCLVNLFNQPVSDENLSETVAWLTRRIFSLNPEKIICTECRYYQKLENDYRIYEVCNHSQARNIINGGARSCDYMRTVICGQQGALFERPAVIDARL